MLNKIPEEIMVQVRRLEALDAADRIDGTPRMERLRQIPPETGKFIGLQMAMSPIGTRIEIGTSAGYSTLYLALACREVGVKIITFEILEEKAKLARETFSSAGVEDVVELIEGDARSYINNYNDISFCFLDAEKEVYSECYELVVEKMVKGGILIADNVISHQEELQPMIDHAMEDDRTDSMIIPIGKGLLFARRTI